MKKKNKIPLIELIKVKSITNKRGEPIADQFIIWTPEGRYLQSFGSFIAFVPISTFIDKVLINTTCWSNQIYKDIYAIDQFLGEGKIETQKKINEGDYLLVIKI
jgi:hypothetical protein